MGTSPLEYRNLWGFRLFLFGLPADLGVERLDETALAAALGVRGGLNPPGRGLFAGGPIPLAIELRLEPEDELLRDVEVELLREFEVELLLELDELPLELELFLFTTAGFLFFLQVLSFLNLRLATQPHFPRTFFPRALLRNALKDCPVMLI